MIKELISMNGYGLFVWSSFIFTFFSFFALFLITKKQLIKESNKFAKKFSKLNSTQTVLAEKQPLNKIFAKNTIVHKI